MFVIYLIFLIISAFCFGFCLGDTTESTDKHKTTHYDKETTELLKEYENFLNYDGTKQS